MTGIIGKKLGMTRVFDDDGFVVPVTVIEDLKARLALEDT